MVKIYYIHGEPDYYFYGYDSYYIYGGFYIYGWLLLHLWLVLHLWVIQRATKKSFPRQLFIPIPL